MQYHYVTAYYWHAGAGGRINQDSLSLQRVKVKGKEAAFLLVCDGIGGLCKGEWASGVVAERMTQWFWEEAVPLLCLRRWSKRIEKSAGEQLCKIQQEIQLYEEQEKMRCGTTCTMAIVCGREYLLLHIGDSRAYLIGKKEKRLTMDQCEGGKLLQCIGDYQKPQPVIAYGRIRNGNMLLLGTDGFCCQAPGGFFKEALGSLWEELTDENECLEEVLETLEKALHQKLAQIGRFLLASKEKDNLTAVVLAAFERRGR